MQPTLWSIAGCANGPPVLVHSETGTVNTDLNADKLDGKHWVEVVNGSTIIANGGFEIILLRTGGQHNMYMVSAYGDTHNVAHGYIAGEFCAILKQRFAPESDFLLLSDYDGARGQTVYYKVYAWE